MVARGLIQRDHKVVVISTANGLKFVDFKVAYHEGKGALANRPIELPADYGVVRDTVRRVLD